MGISIVSLQNKGFLTFCLCLTTGHHLDFMEKLQNSGGKWLSPVSSWGNVVTALLLSLHFNVCGCVCYALYRGKRHPERRKWLGGLVLLLHNNDGQRT